MSSQPSSIESVTPVCAFAFQDGNATPARLNDKPPASGYLWLHLDLNESLAEQWLASQLPDIPARAMVNTHTRPRCEVMDEGVLLNLRGVNLNPTASPDDMVSLRLWVTENRIISVRLRKVFAIDAIKKGRNRTGSNISRSFFCRTHWQLNQAHRICGERNRRDHR